MQSAGGTEAIFEPPVKDLIHDYTGGVPRQINNLATACLLQAAVRNAARVWLAMAGVPPKVVQTVISIPLSR